MSKCELEGKNCPAKIFKVNQLGMNMPTRIISQFLSLEPLSSFIIFLLVTLAVEELLHRTTYSMISDFGEIDLKNAKFFS